jgi:hypothetical protein
VIEHQFVTIFVAQILGPLYLFVAAGILLNAEWYRKMINSFLDNPALTYLGGIMALAFGLVMVNLHNVWLIQWSVIITILGWIALLKGIVLLIWPEPLLRLSASMFNSDKTLHVVAIGAAIFGLFLTVMGYSS